MWRWEPVVYARAGYSVLQEPTVKFLGILQASWLHLSHLKGARVGALILQHQQMLQIKPLNPDGRGLVLKHLQAHLWGKVKANLSIVINFSSSEAWSSNRKVSRYRNVGFFFKNSHGKALYLGLRNLDLIEH